MDSEITEKLIDLGVDYADALHRFLGREDMYVTFLKKYLADTGVADLDRAVKAGDYENAFKAAHSLKGLAGNLGISCVATLASEITEELRNKAAADVDVTTTNELTVKLVEADGEIRKVIEMIG